MTQETDELVKRLAEVAHAENNEATAAPYWMILNPRQMLKPTIGNVGSMLVGPFFSRKDATDYMNATRYRYGPHVGVFCCSGGNSEKFVGLYRASMALRSTIANEATEKESGRG